MKARAFVPFYVTMKLRALLGSEHYVPVELGQWDTEVYHLVLINSIKGK
ncbi:MAG: hypothetical protein ABI539_10580 [Acidobacteriota bacterium]